MTYEWIKWVQEYVMRWACLAFAIVCISGRGESETEPDEPRYRQGHGVYLISGPFKGHEAEIGLYVGNGIYQLNRVKGKDGGGDWIGTLRDDDIVDTALVNVETGEVLWSEK